MVNYCGQLFLSTIVVNNYSCQLLWSTIVVNYYSVVHLNEFHNNKRLTDMNLNSENSNPETQLERKIKLAMRFCEPNLSIT